MLQPRGSAAHRWKGGLTRHQGYVLVHLPGHPRASKIGYVRRGILVAEQKLGRALLPGEIVHHRNQIRDDDRPDNIDVMPSQAAHIALHNRHIRRARKLTEAQVREIKCLLAEPPTERIRRRGRTGVTGRPKDPRSILSIAQRFNVDCKSISAIKDGHSWAWVVV